MPTVGEVIRRLLPHGTNRRKVRGDASSPTWAAPPVWPPDVFAVAATLVELSGCYAHAVVTTADKKSPFGGDYPARIKELGSDWATKGSDALTHRLRELWSNLIEAESEPLLLPVDGSCPDWCLAALQLLAVSDEASIGIGFWSKPNPKTSSGNSAGSVFAASYTERHWESYVGETLGGQGAQKALERRRRHTSTLCIAVPPEEAVVQPKARTPQVGCTLRSLSHHLALLPPVSQVRTSWLMSPDPLHGSLNLLLVPFPYRLNGRAFEPNHKVSSERFGLFDIRQNWMPERSDELAAFLKALVDEAERSEVGRVDAIVLPEIALPREGALQVAQWLAASTNLQMFISGVMDTSAAVPKNRVYSALFFNHDIYTWWDQSKHHRWKLDQAQINRYHLGHALDPSLDWWEHIDIGSREIFFYLFAEDACLTALVCEDLARVDPVQPVVRAVGPNLVIALLMDGPQLERRWPGRYASVLAEDPGSAVLTLTSLGAVRRSDAPGGPASNHVGLWRDNLGPATELRLPESDHALIVTLASRRVEEATLDRRTDGRTSVRLTLAGTRSVRLTAPPAWI